MAEPQSPGRGPSPMQSLWGGANPPPTLHTDAPCLQSRASLQFAQQLQLEDLEVLLELAPHVRGRPPLPL